MTNELRCPVCGGIAEPASWHYGSPYAPASMWYVSCLSQTCDVRGPCCYTDDDAQTAWKRLAYLPDGWRETLFECAAALDCVPNNDPVIQADYQELADRFYAVLGEEPGE